MRAQARTSGSAKLYEMWISPSFGAGDHHGAWMAGVPLLQRTMQSGTADGKNPAWPNIYYTTIIARVVVYELMQDFYHRQYWA